MRLGIDFGTTRTVVAAVDRGNFPVVHFVTETGDTQLWYPSVVATNRDRLEYGFRAEARRLEPGWTVLRSIKRELAHLGPDSPFQFAGRTLSTLELLTGFLTALKDDLENNSNLNVKPGEPFEVLIAVPANSNSNQRFLTLEAFRRAGFLVMGMLNEPSAAGVEYAHSYAPRSGALRKEALAVYDLGGGTFDVSVILVKDRSFQVLGNEGIARLGGDDFDELLLALVLSLSGSVDISKEARTRLIEECRERKEGLHPNTRRFVVDLSEALPDRGEVVVSCEAFYECCAPLVEETIRATESALNRCFSEHELDPDSLAAIYLVGGSSDLPVVARLLRHRFGRRVRRSPFPFAATAIGLAISADQERDFSLEERFSRYFGVWREADSGSRIVFDPIFERDTPLPDSSTPLVLTRNYRSAHNVGHFRYLECSRINEDGEPNGDVTPWDEVFFPFDPELRLKRRFDRVEIQRLNDTASQTVEERYVCDHQGIIEVTITNRTAGYQRTYRLRG